ncbi:Cytochrome b [Trachymyrmex septentrionalis]|uniref:Cytochrome b n=1 Tax=Trachymyrmex septentrionalis TaxID=34720 RepID=A0A195EU85_9HYME|nr:Cytochrome b [Trachymyrmex septentrionalis]
MDWAVSCCLIIYYHNYNFYNSGMVTVLCNRIGDVGILMTMRIKIGRALGGALFISGFYRKHLIMEMVYIEGGKETKYPFGGFSINNSTLNRFFSFHFILSFIIILFIFIHLFFLHSTGSSNPLRINRDLYKIPFHLKDILGFTIIILFFLIIIIQYAYTSSIPNKLGSVIGLLISIIILYTLPFIKSNILIHLQPLFN